MSIRHLANACLYVPIMISIRLKCLDACQLIDVDNVIKVINALYRVYKTKS